MKYVSQLLQPLLTIPKNAKIKNTEITCKSQKLLLECGLIRPTASGLFALLPLALRAVDKLEALVRHHIEEVGGQRLSLPSLTAANLWEKTGRTSEELLKVKDRTGKTFVLAPTHEEAIADLLADVGPLSHKQLPLLLYQISDKFRDELRPKHGVLRARSFRMMDAYGAHASHEHAADTYRRVTGAYDRLFKDLQLEVYRVAAECGDMGGSESHEWQLPAPAGEDRVQAAAGGVSSVEVGHTFILGTRYSSALGAAFVPPSGAPQPLHMSCYGIGITRLLGASLEALSTDTALRWPVAIAPYRVVLIGPKEGSKEWASYDPARVSALAEELELSARVRGDLLCDDRHHMTVGKRVLMADKMGYPQVIVIGKAALESPPRFELRASGRVELLTWSELMMALDGVEKGRATANIKMI